MNIDTSTTEGKAQVMLEAAKGRKVERCYRHAKSEWVPIIESAWNWTDFDFRLAPLEFPPPPPGKTWHNPQNITAEQVGTDHRLLLPEEVDGRFAGKCEHLPGGRNFGYLWRTAVDAVGYATTYRVPISTPFPEPPKAKVKVPLGPEDVPPGSGFKHSKCVKPGFMEPFEVDHYDGIRFIQCGIANGGNLTCDLVTWEELMDWVIIRPGQDWQPCWKEVDA